MRIYKHKYTDKAGGKREVKKYRIELRDHLNIIRRFPAFTDKDSSADLGKQIERLVACKGAGEQPDLQLSRWLEGIPSKLRDRFAEIGLLDRSRAAAGKPLSEHIADFEQSISPTDELSKTAKQTANRVRRIVKDCLFRTWRDVSGDRVDGYIRKELPGVSPQTASHYVKAFRQFCRWLKSKKRIGEVPTISKVKVPRTVERAFELEEFRRLLDVTITGPVLYGMSGPERYLCYIVAAETGLRRGELRSLTPASFDFNDNSAFVSGKNTKNNDDAVQRLTEKTLGLIRDFIRGKMPNVQLFNIHDKSSRMIQGDCEAAGIEVENNKGKIKFHTLRHSCGSFLAAQGIHPKVIQKIMRHKDINLTMDRYCHLLSGQVDAAMDLMPDFSQQSQKATGTDVKS